MTRSDAVAEVDEIEEWEIPDDNSVQGFFIRDIHYIALRHIKNLRMRHEGPCSVFKAEGQEIITRDWLQERIKSYRSGDDVFCDDFLNGVIFTGTTKEPVAPLSPDANEFLKSLGNVWTDSANKWNTLPPGPYLAHDQHIREVYRLYDDVQGAFMDSILLRESLYIHIKGQYPQTIKIAVPSRIRCLMTEKKPLANLRVAVKDIFQIRGVRTSLSNRAYYELYPPAIESAECVKLLIRAGANIVGTTKLASFAATEEPIECVDFQAPWNPRADGYQSPAGSSSGSGAAIASYWWLDIAIGSDTSGSGRRPGHWNGCFAMRPSHGILPVKGYIPSFRRFDVPVFYGRDIEKCKYFAIHWYGRELNRKALLPFSIVYPTDYMALITNEDQRRLIDGFVWDLEASLGVKRRVLSFDSLWDTRPPPKAQGQSLQEYMKDACRNSFFHDDYHNFDQFRSDYFEKYSKTPYISPPVHWQWAQSAKISSEERDVAVARLEVYREWFSQEVMQADTHTTIVIIPIENISPRYRDNATSRFWPVGVPMLFLSPISGGPELTVPIGEVPFDSKVTNRREHLPVAVSLLASPGQDIELFSYAQECLEKSGRPTKICAGNKLFGG